MDRRCGRQRLMRVLAGVSLILAGCSSAAPPSTGDPAPGTETVPAPRAASAPPPPPLVSAHAARVSGTAPIPQDDVPAVVVLEPAVTYAYPIPDRRPMMDQVATRFTPAALVVRTGQTVDFRNDDDKLHNVRVRERGHAADDLVFNIALSQGVTYPFTFWKDGVWDVRCDMHQNMYGLVVSTASPYSALAGSDGTFTIDGVPPGDYSAVAYTSRDRSQKAIRLEPGQRLALTLP